MSKQTKGRRIAVVGLGYVGLPVALAFGRAFERVIGFDVNEARVRGLCNGHDSTGESTAEEIAAATALRCTSDPADLAGADFFVIAVPTPIDANRRPDLEPLRKASETVGRALKPGGIVVYESTVYPGVTEEFCGPILAKVSGLQQGKDFKLGYSPERINPGDRQHTLERIVKVVAGEDAETLEVCAAIYGAIVDAGIYRAPTIKVAEAAKVIENTQRDLNIALMNEFALIFDRLDIRTQDVLTAAGTKWNFLKFSPGLVGGHCIGVDPYYLTTKAEEVGYHPQVILAGRRINDNMGNYVAQRVVKLLAAAGLPIAKSRVGVLGLTFKENVSDLRNSRVPDILAELRTFGIDPLVHDAYADRDEAERYYGVKLVDRGELRDLHALVLAVPHRAYLEQPATELVAAVREGGIVVDVKSALSPEKVGPGRTYWSL